MRALWSKGAFYMLWDVLDAGFFVDASRPIKVGPLGNLFDIAVDKKQKKSDPAWSSLPEIATHVDRQHHRATIEIALRSPDILRALLPGTKLRFALYRMEGKSPRLYLAWSPSRTEKPDFHVPEAFGTLSIE